MILFTILATIALTIVCMILFVAISGGVITLAVFGDAIVCALLIIVVIKLFRRKKK